MEAIKSLWSTAIASRYLRNLAVLATGTGLAQMIRLGTSPITRSLYSPEDFGLFSLVFSISIICGSVAMGRYEMAIMLPKQESKAIQLCFLSFFLACGFSTLVLAVVLVFGGKIAAWLGQPDAALWLFLIPIVVFGNSVYRILYNFNNRLGNYKDISKTQLLQQIGLAIISISLGIILKNSVVGLMIAGTVSSYLGIGLLKTAFLGKASFSDVRLSELKVVAVEQKKFPKYSVWAGLANTLSAHALDIFIGITFTIALLGQYSLTKVVCGLPTSVMGAALMQVFYQRIVQCKNENGDCLAIFKTTLIYLAVFSSLVFTAMFFVAEPGISLVFGEKWAPAAEFTKLLVPFYGVRFVSSAFSITTSAFERQELTLVTNLTLLLSLICVIGAKVHFNLSLKSSLIAYASVFAFDYLIFLVLYWKIITHYQNSRAVVN